MQVELNSSPIMSQNPDKTIKLSKFYFKNQVHLLSRDERILSWGYKMERRV